MKENTDQNLTEKEQDLKKFIDKVRIIRECSEKNSSPYCSGCSSCS